MVQSDGSRFILLRELFLLGMLAAVVLLTGLGENHHRANREARHAEIIREMAVRGDFLVPRFLGQPYRKKPPVILLRLGKPVPPPS